MKDYYKILEVNKDASGEVIARVYKLLAKKYHPDLQDEQNKIASAEKFKEISEAYEILSDEKKREIYDQQLENAQQENLVDKNDYEDLKDYCVQLENELDNMKDSYINLNNNTNNMETQQTTQATQGTHNNNNNVSSQAYNNSINQAYNDALNKAYHDAYINNLRNLGYKIRYKKSFKEICKNTIALVITGVVIFIVFKIIWIIPPLKEYILSLFRI